jgi:putative tryptophan/tyrosine transport system substrate-binding protein
MIITKKKNLLLIAILTALTIAGFAIFSDQNKNPKDFNLTILSIVEIDPITQLRKGFRKEFEASEFAKSHKVVIAEENAQGDPSLINQISDKIATRQPDLVYVLGTPTAQALQKRAPNLLIVQGAVTDPVAAGLAKSWQGSGKKYIATSDLPPVDKQINLIQELTPKISRLGLIYNPGEANSVAVVARIREQLKLKKLNWNLVERPVANSSEVARSVETLVGKVDAIYLPPDNTAHSAMRVIGKLTRENKIPLYASVKDALKEGAVATLALDYEELGKESAKLALTVLGGQDPATIPIKLNENPTITINAKAAKDYGIDISKFRSRNNIKFIE